jgi:hypothetical protein
MLFAALLFVAACSSSGDAAPILDAGLPDGGEPITLDGRSSCDPEGGVLTYQWSLASAPAGSRWPIADTSSAQATLTPDVEGAYRVALQVTDSQGAQSDLAFLSLEVNEP